MNTAPNQELFELAPEEIVVPLRIVVSGGSRAIRLTHVFRPPALDDWLAYDRALKLTIRETADDSVFHSQAGEAAALLWQRAILRVEGYKLSGTAEEWQDRVPLEHKQQAVRGLALVEPEPARPGGEDELYRLDFETREIRLRAHRNGRWCAGLAHRFRRPTTEDELSYRRILSELYVVRGSGETRVPPRLGGLVRLYDRLILSVEGYAVRGSPPAIKLGGFTASGTPLDGRNPSSGFSEMDALHKRVAVEALFGELSTLEADADPSSQSNAGE